MRKEVTEMRKFGTVIGLVLTALLTIGVALMSAQPANQKGSIQINNKDEAQLAEMAKISLDSAMNEALKQVQGKVLRVEMENENGYLVYGVEIAKPDHQIVDVKVDAGNGKILRIDQDNNEGHEREGSDNGREEVNER
jgi:uncharacterized membrane protein YkoI